MKEFVTQVVIPLAKKRHWKSFCEIGASLGSSTDRLLALPTVSITLVDPCLDVDLAAKYGQEPRVALRRGLSLDVLPSLNASFDCILVDGDHNWYTVYRELEIIHWKKLVNHGGVIFVDDVEWPYGRRDMYYQPEAIPPSYRHRYARRGMVRGVRELEAHFGLNHQFCNALHEGGKQNGVMTAVEDFLHAHRAEYRFFRLQKDAGLGAILPRGSVLDDFWFLVKAWQAATYNFFTWPKRAARSRLPNAYRLAKSLLGRA